MNIILFVIILVIIFVGALDVLLYEEAIRKANPIESYQGKLHKPWYCKLPGGGIVWWLKIK